MLNQSSIFWIKNQHILFWNIPKQQCCWIIVIYIDTFAFEHNHTTISVLYSIKSMQHCINYNVNKVINYFDMAILLHISSLLSNHKRFYLCIQCQTRILKWVWGWVGWFENLSPASTQKLDIDIVQWAEERKSGEEGVGEREWKSERAGGEHSLTSFTTVGNAINCMFNRVFQIFQISYKLATNQPASCRALISIKQKLLKFLQ